MNAPQTHLQPAGATQRPCDHCGTPFTPRRSWSRFCRSKCRNDYHLAEAHKATAAKLELVRGVLRHVGDQVGGDIGSDIAAMDPKAVLAATEPKQR